MEKGLCWLKTDTKSMEGDKGYCELLVISTGTAHIPQSIVKEHSDGDMSGMGCTISLADIVENIKSKTTSHDARTVLLLHELNIMSSFQNYPFLTL
jgi:hypothetical protein